MVFRMFRKNAATPEAPVVTEGQVPSPCNGICDMDWMEKLCKSCHRTVIEIGEWGQMGDEQRLAVLAKLEERKGG